MTLLLLCAKEPLKAFQIVHVVLFTSWGVKHRGWGAVSSSQTRSLCWPNAAGVGRRARGWTVVQHLGQEPQNMESVNFTLSFSEALDQCWDQCTFPKATEGEKGPPALFGVGGLLRGGLYPGTQLGENLGLVVADREGLKLSTLCPCRGEDWAGAGVSFFSGFWGGEAWIPAKEQRPSALECLHTTYNDSLKKWEIKRTREKTQPHLCSLAPGEDAAQGIQQLWMETWCIWNISRSQKEHWG